MTLRELHQVSLVFTQQHVPMHVPQDSSAIQKWQTNTREQIVELVHCTIRVVKNGKEASYLSRNKEPVLSKNDDDPMVLCQILRSHLYSVDELHILEKSRMCDMLHEYCHAYRELLKLASTPPLPFFMIQMEQTFVFLWTFTLGFALVGVIDDVRRSVVFVFFLTYGFIGMEFVSHKLLHPFGNDSVHDVNVVGMGQAVLVGMDADAEAMSFRRRKPLGPSDKEQRHLPPTESIHRAPLQRGGQNNDIYQSQSTIDSVDDDDDGAEDHALPS